MSDIFITITQALQLVALVPSIFVVVFLLCMSKRDYSNIVPIGYFLALSCQFIIPLLPILNLSDPHHTWISGGLMFGTSLVAAFSFLLIVQFLRGNIPPPLYWLVLAIPIIGGTPFIYAALQATEVCLDQNYCIVTDNLRVLYDVASSCLVFLLVVIYIARGNASIAIDDVDRTHKYWLIIALVMLNLAIVAIDLLTLNQNLAASNALLVATIIRIGFIYLVLTSIFRLFYDLFEIRMPDSNDSNKQVTYNPALDKKAVEQLTDLLEHQHIYREMGLSRKHVAEQLSLGEHQLSRIINSYFKKNFNELVNQYRVDEAKQRLRNEKTQITTIAYEVGFNSIASFNRVFKELTEASPTAYRSFQRVK